MNYHQMLQRMETQLPFLLSIEKECDQRRNGHAAAGFFDFYSCVFGSTSGRLISRGEGEKNVNRHSSFPSDKMGRLSSVRPAS